MSLTIVVTDGYTLNPGDLDWRPLRDLGDLDVFDRTRENELIGRIANADIIVTNKTPLSASAIESCRNLKLIAVTATGFNVVDISAAAGRNIPVCNVPGYGTASVAQHTFALILELTNRVGLNAASVAAGEWSVAKDWCYSRGSITELHGKTLGIVGYGKIGQQVARIAMAFGMRILFHSPSRLEEPGAATLEQLFAESDVVSLHCPLTPQNAGFVNASLLMRMKRSAFLVNTARGQLIHERDLATALQSGVIAGAGLDVLSKEPPGWDNPLIGLENCIITPHSAWLSIEARGRIMNITKENIRQFLRGKPQNVVNFGKP